MSRYFRKSTLEMSLVAHQQSSMQEESLPHSDCRTSCGAFADHGE